MSCLVLNTASPSQTITWACGRATHSQISRTDFYGFEDTKIEWENSALTLPSVGTVALGDGAQRRLAVAHEHDVHKALQYFILGTTAEAIRTIEGRPFDDDVLKFVRYRIESATSSAKMATFYTFGEPVPVMSRPLHENWEMPYTDGRAHSRRGCCGLAS